MTDPTLPLPPAQSPAQPPALPPTQPPAEPPTATTVAPPPYVGPPAPVPDAQPQPQRGGLAVLVLASVVAGLLLVGAGFGLGRLTAPSGPASLIDAVRMAQQGTLPCGAAPQGNGAAGPLARLCRLGPGQGGGFGPGQTPRGFGPNGNGNGNGNRNGTPAPSTPSGAPTA